MHSINFMFDFSCGVTVMLYAGSDMPLYAFSLFLPSIINQVRPIFPSGLITLDISLARLESLCFPKKQFC